MYVDNFSIVVSESVALIVSFKQQALCLYKDICLTLPWIELLEMIMQSNIVDQNNYIGS